MILTVTPNPALDKFYWLSGLPETLAPTEEGLLIRAFLAAHGMDPGAMGFLGGHTGLAILQDQFRPGVSANFVWIEGNRTNAALIVRGREHHPIHITEEGPPIPPGAGETSLRNYVGMLRHVSFVVLAGHSALGLSPHFFGEWARRARALGVRVLVHTGGAPLLRTFPDL